MKPSPLITDPKAGEYPGFSPYANRGCNPTRNLDPSGEEIVITHMSKTYKLWDSEGVLFTPGGDGVSDPVPDEVDVIVKGLQAAYTYGSAEMVGNMINSDRTFNYLVGAGDGDTFTEPDGKGGSISTIAQGGMLSRETVTAAVVHETMHHAQFMHGQGGRFVANEVEAYTFQYAVSYNMYNDNVFTGYPPTSTPDEFGKVQVDLGLDGYSFSKFIDGVNTFKNSGYNNSGKYDSYKSYFPLSWKPLLKLYNIKSR